MARTEDLLVRIDATTEQLRREMKRADQTISRSTHTMDRRLKRVDAAFSRLNRAAATVTRTLGALGIALGAREIIQFAAQTLNSAEAIERQSRALGVTIERFQELQFAFRQYNLESNDIADVLNTLADRAQDAEDGMQSFIDDFALIGLEVDELRGKNPFELFRTFADAIQQTSDVGVRNAAVVRILGDDIGAKLLPMLLEGAEGLDEMAARAHELNAVLGDETVRSGAEAARQLRELREEIRGNLQAAILDNKEAILGLVQGFNALIDAAAQGDLLPDFFSRAEEGANGFRQELEKAARIILSIAGAKVGTGIGSRFGAGGAIVGGVGGGVLGFFSPDLLRLKVEIDGREQTLEQLREQLEAYQARKAELERELDAAGERMAGEPSHLVGKQSELNLLKKDIREIEQAIEYVEQREQAAAEEAERALEELSKPSPPAAPAQRPGAEADPLGPVIQHTYEPSTLPKVDAEAYQRELDDQARKTLASLDSTYAAARRYAEQLKQIDQVTEQLNLSEAQRIALQEQAREEYVQSIDVVEEHTNRLTEVANQLGFAFESAFEDAIINAEDFSDVLQGLANDIQRILLRTAVTNPLANFFTSLLPFGGPTPEGKASGGSVSADRLYVVGEKGPELFAPGVSGSIIPNHSLGGSADVTINIINESGQALKAEQGATRRGANGEITVDMLVRSSIERLDGQGMLDGIFRRHGARRVGQY